MSILTDKENAFLEAAEKGDIATLETLISGKVNVNIQNDHGNTALHWAAARGHTDSLELLIKAGAGLDIQDYGRYTALHLAAYYGHTDIVELLIKADANLNIPNNRGKTALTLAEEEGRTDIIELLKAEHARRAAAAAQAAKQETFKRNADSVTQVITALQTRKHRQPAPALKRRRVKRVKR